MLIHKQCDKSLANDKSLPINSYIITYLLDDEKMYDIVQASSVCEVFDKYYDDYGKGSIQEIKWTNGKVSPKMYGYKPKETKKKR
jgi:hypothetical protein